MRIRTIKPDFFLHEELFDLEESTGLPVRLAYQGLWCASDREGRFVWRPRKLKAQILPFDSVDFSRVLDALITRGFVVRYTSGGEAFGYIPSFTAHQVINNREQESVLPDPVEAANDAELTRAPRVNDACPTPLKRALAEGNREGEGNMEGKGRECSDAKASLGEEPAQQGELLPAPNCPYSKIKDLYHEKCPSMPRVRMDTDTRRELVRHRWRQFKGDLAAFEILFEKAEASDFLAGRAPPGNGRTRPFMADFDWLMQAKNMVKTLERKYDND